MQYVRHKTNEIVVNKFLLWEDKFMPGINLRQPGFIYSACGAFTKNKKQNTKIQRNGKFPIYLSKRTR